MWRINLLYNLLSDYEILRLRSVIMFDSITCRRFRHRQIPKFSPQTYSILEKNELGNRMGNFGKALRKIEKHFFDERIQDDIDPSIRSVGNKE